MGDTIRTIFLIVAFSILMSFQTNMSADIRTTHQLKNGAEIAVHDAMLAYNKEELSKGKVVFNQAYAKKYLVDSLNANLKLTGTATSATLYPKKDSFFTQPVKILKVVFVDESNTKSFPYTYKDPEYDVTQILKRPGIVAILETKAPRYFKGEDTIVRQATSFEFQQSWVEN